METTRVRYFLDLLIDKKKAIMLVGSAGTGKSVIINEKLKSLPNDLYSIASVPLNFYTTSGTYLNNTNSISLNLIYTRLNVIFRIILMLTIIELYKLAIIITKYKNKTNYNT